MTEFIRGPWTFVKDGELVHLLDREGKIVDFTANNFALMRFIAAAPELYEALHDAIVLIDNLMPGVAYIALQDYGALNDTPIKARAALAKARGE